MSEMRRRDAIRDAPRLFLRRSRTAPIIADFDAAWLRHATVPLSSSPLHDDYGAERHLNLSSYSSCLLADVDDERDAA